jgi:hypothetical protein
MKYLFFLFLAAQAAIYAQKSFAQVVNFDNSPYNMDNSPHNSSATNGVYNNSGSRIGYEVKAPSGVTNYLDNSGNRIGYTPAKQ